MFIKIAKENYPRSKNLGFKDANENNLVIKVNVLVAVWHYASTIEKNKIEVYVVL